MKILCIFHIHDIQDYNYMSSKRAPGDYCHTLGNSSSIHDASSGVMRARFESQSEPTGDFNARVEWTSAAGAKKHPFSTDAIIGQASGKYYAELSFNLAETDISSNPPDADTLVHLKIMDSADTEKYSITMSAEQIYDLPQSIDIQDGAAGIQRSGRFSTAADDKGRGGDIFKQHVDLTEPRNVVIDFCGGVTGFTKAFTRDISWVRDICMSTAETLAAADWKAVSDQSSNVSTGRGTSRFEVALSGESVFDASHLYLKAYLKVPGAIEVAGELPDVSLVTLDLSAHLGNLASLQKVELLERSGFRTIYDTPDVMYVHGTQLFRDRAKTQPITDISYLIAGRNYYFCSLDGGAAVDRSGATSTRVPNGSLTQITWDRSGVGQTTALTNTRFSASYLIPIVADISHALSGIKDKTNVKFIGNDVGDAPSSIAYRLTFSHPKPSDFEFDGVTPKLEFDEVDKHVGAGKHDIKVGVRDSSCVDISFVIRTPTIQSSVSLENMFVTSKTSQLYGIGDVSSSLLPNIVYPKEYLYGIPSDFSFDKTAGGEWLGVVTTSGGTLATRINSMYDSAEYNEYMSLLPAAGETNRTFFDVNQPTNYVEISLNQMFPSGVSAEWFDASYIEYSTYANAGSAAEVPENTWISVSFDKAADKMIKGANNDTVAFSICGECLDSHNIWLRQHFRMHEKQTATDTLSTRDVSFVRDFSAHLMRRPVLVSFEMLDHADMQYKNPADVSHVINFKPIPGRELNTTFWPDKTGQLNGWNEIYDLSCVARYTFDASGADSHNTLEHHYKIDASMGYTDATGSRVHIDISKSYHGSNILDISGDLRHSDISFDERVNDISFSMTLRRNNANVSQMMDVSVNTQTFTLSYEQIWQIPTDISFVKAMTLSGDGGLGTYVHGQMFEYALTKTENNEGLVFGKFTNKPEDVSHNYQRLTFDFSGGSFPTSKRSNYIRDISYSVVGPNLGADFQDSVTQRQTDIVDICDTIQPTKAADGLLRRVTFDICKSAIQYSQMWLKIGYHNIGNKYYCFSKTIKEFLEAKKPEQQFTIWGYYDTFPRWIDPFPIIKNLTSYQDPLFKPSSKHTDEGGVSVADDTGGRGYFSQLNDVSLSFYFKSGDSKEETISKDVHWFDISYEYYYQTYASYRANPELRLDPGHPKYMVSLTPDNTVYNQTDISLGLHMKWRDISKGLPSRLVFYAADMSYTNTNNVGQGEILEDLSSLYFQVNIIQYRPPDINIVIPRAWNHASPDVCSNITAHNVLPRTLADGVPGKKISFMASGEVQIDFGGGSQWACSYDRIPADVGDATTRDETIKASIQRMIHSIDISYGSDTGKNHAGLLGYPDENGIENDISCIPGPAEADYIGGSTYNSTSRICFNFDASMDQTSFQRYNPNIAPLHDLSININFYTDLTHSYSDISTTTWTVPRANIDWLNPPTTFLDDKRITRYKTGNAPIPGAGGSDLSFSVMRDTSSTLVMDQRFHPFFQKRYADDNSGMIVEMSLNWAYYEGEEPYTPAARKVDTFVINKSIVTPATEYDQSYMLLNLSWLDMSKGLLVDGDASSVHINMRIHTTREKNGDVCWNDISFDIPASSIEQYVAPEESNWKDISCIYGAAGTPLTDFSLTNLYNLDPCLNLLFDVSFGIYGESNMPSVDDVIKDVSYSWLDRSNYKRVGDASRAIVRLDDGRDYLQLKLKSADMSKGVPNFFDTSGMHVRVELYRDRAKTTSSSSMLRCISMGIPTRDISCYISPDEINGVDASTSAPNISPLAKDTIMINGFTGDLSINIDTSQSLLSDSQWKRFYSTVSSDYIETLVDISLTYNGHSVACDFVDISSDRKTLLTLFRGIQGKGFTLNAGVTDASINVNIFKDLEKKDKKLIEKTLKVNRTSGHPVGINTIQNKHFADCSFSIFGGSTTNLNEGISFEVLVQGKFTSSHTASSDYIVHQDSGSVEYQWSPLDDRWRSKGVSDISISIRGNKSYVTFKLDASDVLLAGSLDSAVPADKTLDISMHLYDTPGGSTSRGVTLDAPPTVLQVKHFEYPKSIEDVSSTLDGAQFGDASMTLWDDSSLNLIVSSGRPWFTSEYGGGWQASDYVIDASVTLFTSKVEVSFNVGAGDISFIDASKMALRLKFDDISKGCLSGGRVEISMNIHTDLSDGNTDFSRILHMVVPHTDVSYYQPPTSIIKEETKGSLTNTSAANRVLFSDASFTTWSDCSLTFRLDEQIIASYGSRVAGLISEVKYSHDFSGGAGGDMIQSSRQKTIAAANYDISSDARYITVRTRGEDLSAGALPKTRDYGTWQADPDSNSNEISFNIKVFTDLAKTPTFIDDISMVLKESDISYYRPPLWFNEGRNPKVFDVSSEINGVALSSSYKLYTLHDTSVNLTICDDVFTKYADWIHPLGFPSRTASDWVAGISLENQNGGDSLTHYIDQDSIQLLGNPSDVSNVRIKFGMRSVTEYLSPATFTVRMYNDRSKSESRTHITKVGVTSSEISQNTAPTKFTDTFDDIDDDFSINLMPRPFTEPEIGIALKFASVIDPKGATGSAYGISDESILQYQVVNVNSGTTEMSDWESAGTKFKLRGDKITLDISLDVAKLWHYKLPEATYTENYIDFSLSIYKHDGGGTANGEYAHTVLQSGLLAREKVNFFYVNSSTDSLDVSAIDIGGGKKFSLIQGGDVSINATPSAEHYESGKAYESRLYFDDISYHVRDISWVYNSPGYEVSGHYDIRSNQYLAARSTTYSNFTSSATFGDLINPKTVDMPVALKAGVTEVSGVQFHMCDVRDLSRGLPGSITYTMNVYDDLSYTATSRTHTQVSRTIPSSAIEHYEYPKRVLDISFQKAVTGEQFPSNTSFSNLHDLSVNFDLSFDLNKIASDANFYKHLDGTSVTVQNVVKNMSFVWNNGLPIRVEHTDMSLVSSTHLQFKVKQNDISTYPVQGISFNVLFFKDMAKTGEAVASLLEDVSLAIDGAHMQKYEFPKHVLDISFRRADATGAYFSPDFSFSNLHDLSVNFDLSFDVNDATASFYKHTKGSAVTVQDVVKDLSFVWNDGPPIQVLRTDMSLVSSTHMQFKVKQNDISTYPIEGISFNVLFFKDLAKIDSRVNDVSLAIVASDISTVTIPTRITKFKAYRVNAGSKSFYDDCSLSLIDASGTGRSTELATLAYCSISFDQPLTQERLQIGPTSSLMWPITFDISRAEGTGTSEYYGVSGEVDGFGVSYENVTIGADGKTLDFSFDVSPILQGLTFKSANDCLKFRLRFNRNSIISPVSQALTDVCGTELLEVNFKDISYYDGRQLLDASNFALDEGGIPSRASVWNGALFDGSFNTMKDISMQVYLPFKAGRSPRFSFKLKSSNAGDMSFLSIHDVVRDISISYSSSMSVCLSGNDLSGRVFHDAAEGFPKLEFRIPSKTNAPVGVNDLSMTVYFKSDLCGNVSKFETEYIDASYVISKDNVIGFNGPNRVDHTQTTLLDSTKLGSSSKPRLTMRDDVSMTVFLSYPLDIRTLDLSTNGSSVNAHLNDISNHVDIYDISYMYNDAPWTRVPYEDISLTPGLANDGTDISLIFRIPKRTSYYRTGDFALSMKVRNAVNFIPADSTKFKAETKTVAYEDISENEGLVLSFNSNTISYDSVSKRILGFNLGGARNDGTTFEEATMVKFPTTKGDYGLSYEATNLCVVGTATPSSSKTYDISTGASPSDMSWGAFFKGERSRKVHAIVYAGRAGDQNAATSMVRFNLHPDDSVVDTSYFRFGVTSNSAGAGTVNTRNWAGRINFANHWVNNFTLTPNSGDFNQGEAHSVGNKANNPEAVFSNTFPASNSLGGKTSNFIIGFSFKNPIDLSTIVFGDVADTYSGVHTTNTDGAVINEHKSRMYDMRLYLDSSFSSMEDLSNACRSMLSYMETFTKPNIELTKNNNRDWQASQSWFNSPALQNLIFDISSDTSLNLVNMKRQDHIYTFFYARTSSSSVQNILMYHKDDQLQNIQTNNASLFPAISISFDWHTFDADISHSCRRFLLEQERPPWHALNMIQLHATEPMRVYNVYDASDNRYINYVDISMALTNNKTVQTETSILTYSDPT